MPRTTLRIDRIGKRATMLLASCTATLGLAWTAAPEGLTPDEPGAAAGAGAGAEAEAEAEAEAGAGAGAGAATATTTESGSAAAASASDAAASTSSASGVTAADAVVHHPFAERETPTSTVDPGTTVPLTTSLEDELPMAPAGWSGRVTPYLWFSGVNGDIQDGSASSDVHESPFGALGDAELGVLVNAEAHHGVHGAWVELYGQQIEDEHASSGGASADAEIEQASFEAVYVHTLADHPSTDVYAGLRHWAVDTKIDLDAGPSSSRDESWVDPIVGVRRRFVLSDTWNLTARGDVGGLNIGDASDFSWNLVAQAEHPFSDRATWVIGYRALGVDYDKGSSFEHDVITHGVLTGVSVRF